MCRERPCFWDLGSGRQGRVLCAQEVPQEGLGAGVPMTSVQSFQESGLRDSNPFLSLLPLPVNQTPPRPESARSWSHIPATCHTSGHLSWVLGLGKWPDPGSRARKKAGSWFLHLPDHLPLISSLQTLSKDQACPPLSRDSYYVQVRS